MIKFKTRATWVLLFVFVVSFLLIAYLLLEAGKIWENNKARSLKLISLAGIVSQIAGFIILLNPIITRIFTKRESNLRYDGVIYVLAGLLMQGFSVYHSP